MLDQVVTAAAEYLNPVYPYSFPDPFVLKFGGAYYAYATGFAKDGTVFPVLCSPDLVTWKDVGGAMEPLASAPPFYWAPEVTYDNGKFYLYYSVGNEEFMELRVAVSNRPERGFVDSGVRLTSEKFAIDAHVFVDEDGSKYLFYATDFLDHAYIGTGTVVDRMLDWFTLAGDPKPVTRARYDWQVYDANRKEKGGVRWHTVEGPTVLKRKSRYYEMFSGGNWQNMSYGVSFAIADTLERDDEWLQFSDGENTLPILRTIPDRVVGPGHNCVVRGPNNRELYCVYHRWTEAGRVMAIDRMDFAGDRIFVVGASDSPQPAPYPPTVAKYVRAGDHDRTLSYSETSLEIVPESFLTELTWCFADPPRGDAQFGIVFETDDDRTSLTFGPANGIVYAGAGSNPPVDALPPEFVWTAPHLLRIDVDHRKMCVHLDSVAVGAKVLDSPVRRLTAFSNDEAVRLSSFEMTEGFEELFRNSDLGLEENGWIVEGGHHLLADEMIFPSGCSLRKGPSLESLDAVTNIRLMDGNAFKGEFGLILFSGDLEVFRLCVGHENLSIFATDHETMTFPFPQDINLYQHHQLRIVKMKPRVLCYFDEVLVKDLTLELKETSVGVFAKGASVAIDMIRLTSI